MERNVHVPPIKVQVLLDENFKVHKKTAISESTSYHLAYSLTYIVNKCIFLLQPSP